MSHDLDVTTAVKTALRELVSRGIFRDPPSSASISRLELTPYQGEVAPPKPLDLDEIAQRVVERFSRGLLPERRDLRHAGFCVWETKTRLADQSAGFEAYLKRIGSCARKSEYKRLAEAYFRAFDPNTPTLPKVAAILADLAPQIGADWGRRAADYCVFDPVRGPVELARIVLNQETDVINYLRNRDRMPESLANTRFAQAAWREGLSIIDAEVKEERERFDLLKRWNGPNERTILFEGDKLPLVDAIVAPYRKSGPEDKRLRDQILNYLLGILGDPRIRAERWTGLDGPRIVVNRWLVDQSFRQFLDVVEHISENAQHWEYRRAFWEAVHQKCEITNIPLNAWVVFASRGEHVAKKRFGSNTSFGVFRDAGSQLLESHAALMVEIGDYLFVDWNEHSPCNLWRRNVSARRPMLYQQIYHRDQLRHSSPRTRTDDVLLPAGIFDHRGSLNFKWQEKLAKEISDARGPRLRQIDYRPRPR
jgi:hypothetical protein